MRLIRERCGQRCVLCMRRLGHVGQCCHVLDRSDKKGEPMESYAKDNGVLKSAFSRSSPENGLLLCPSCHHDLLTRHLLVFSPPKELLRYLVDLVEKDPSVPIHEALDRIDSSHPIRRLRNLYTVVPLDPKAMEKIDFSFYYGASGFLDDSWTAVPPPSADHTAEVYAAGIYTEIYDAASLPDSSDTSHSNLKIDFSSPSDHVRRFWHLHVDFTAILAYLLHVSDLPVRDTEEVQLARKLSKLFKEGPGPSTPTSSRVRYNDGNLGGGRNAGGKGSKKRSHQPPPVAKRAGHADKAARFTQITSLSPLNINRIWHWLSAPSLNPPPVPYRYQPARQLPAIFPLLNINRILHWLSAPSLNPSLVPYRYRPARQLPAIMPLLNINRTIWHRLSAPSLNPPLVPYRYRPARQLPAILPRLGRFFAHLIRTVRS